MAEAARAPGPTGLAGTVGEAGASPLAVIAIGAVMLGALLRLLVGADLPLWLDETFTGALAAEPTFERVVRQSLLEANGPLYIFLMHFWSAAFGLSNTALRFPSVVFGMLAPLVALVPAKGIGRDTRLIWCALVALWIPGIWYSQEARCYSLLLFLTMSCTVAYVRLLAVPDLRRAMIWCGLGALAILTHYHALLLIGLQGLAYLAVHRLRAVRTWPAALVFLPAFGWIGLQLPRIRELGDPNVAWFATMTPSELAGVVEFVLGDLGLTAPLLAMAALSLYFGWRGNDPRHASEAEAQDSFFPDVAVAVGCAVLGATALVLMGMFYPSFTERYLMPFMPGILLGFAFTVRQLARRWALAPAGIVLVMAAATGGWVIKNSERNVKLYSYEVASRALMTPDTKRIVFLWDNPLAAAYDRSQLKAAGGFFFQREGKPIPVEPIYLTAGQDPNVRLVAAADSPGSAILWIYDLQVRATAASAYPPKIEQIDPAWKCRNHAQHRFGVIACTRNTDSPP